MTTQDERGGLVPDIEPEADRVARHKLALERALKEVVAAAEAARRDGFYIEFQVGMNHFGQYALVQPPALIKRF